MVVHDVQRTRGSGRGGFRGGIGKRVDGMASGRLNDRRSRGGWMNGTKHVKKGGIFITKWIATGRVGAGCDTTCSIMSERDRKDRREGSRKQAGLCWFARHY